jgi:hypothetical protein
MSIHSGPTPQLTVVSGRFRGISFDIRPGRSTIGRVTDVEIPLDDENVSRRHAILDRAGTRVVLTDLGSTNGTWINGRVLRGARDLRDDDLVRVGAVELRFSTARADPGTKVVPPGSPGEREGRGVRYDFGGVDGPVQAGDGVQYAAGRDQYLAHGDQYLAGRDRYDQRSWQVHAPGGMAAGRDLHANDYSVNVNADYDPSDELFQGKGFGRILMAFGWCIALIGFGMWAYVIFQGANAGFDGPNPFERELVPGVPMAITAFAAFIGGGVLAGIGGGM